jgi:hypothetical protein
MKQNFMELTPRFYHPNCIAMWISADDIEQSTFYMLDHYDIEWGCKPKPEWFNLDDQDILTLNLPVLELFQLPGGHHSIRFVSGVNRLMWMMGTHLNEIMVMIEKDQYQEWREAGFRMEHVHPGSRVKVNPFNVDEIVRKKCRSLSGRFIG